MVNALAGVLLPAFTPQWPRQLAPGQGTTILVQTDRNGVAETYFQLGGGNPEDVQEVNVRVGDVAPASPFRHEIATSRRIPTIEIVSGNSQRADSNGEIDDPLVVVVKRGGKRIQSKPVTFHHTQRLFTGRNWAVALILLTTVSTRYRFKR